MLKKKESIHKEVLSVLRAYVNGDDSVVSRVKTVSAKTLETREERNEVTTGARYADIRG